MGLEDIRHPRRWATLTAARATLWVPWVPGGLRGRETGVGVVRSQSAVQGGWYEDPWPCVRLLVFATASGACRRKRGDIQPQARSWGASGASGDAASLSHWK